MAFVDLFGDNLRKADGSVATSEALADCDAVGIYFSAHWCGPCRGFTPELAEAYNTMKAAGKKFEIVFASSDRDAAAFDGYFAEMPWLALPYDDAGKAAKAALSKKYKVSGIPTFVILDKDGNTITTDGRTAITNDPTGDDFPWTPPTFEEALGTTFTKQGETVGAEAIRGKTLGLYFSAHWCPPCRGFTPKLIATYNAMKAAGNTDFEIVFVSSDRDQTSFDEYYGEMPWLALPFSDRKAKSALSSMFDVEGIPSLVIMGPDGKVINNESAVGMVASDPSGAKFPWTPPLVAPAGAVGGFVNESTTMLVLAEGLSAEAAAEAEAAVNTVAAAAVAAGSEIRFGFAGPDDLGNGMVAQVRKLTNAGDATDAPLVMILDIPDAGAYYTLEAAYGCSSDALEQMLKDYAAKELTRKQLG